MVIYFKQESFKFGRRGSYVSEECFSFSVKYIYAEHVVWCTERRCRKELKYFYKHSKT